MRVCMRNWLTLSWKLRSLNIWGLQAEDLRKLVKLFSLSPTAWEPGSQRHKSWSEGRRSWDEKFQLMHGGRKTRAGSSFLQILCYSGPQKIWEDTHIEEDNLLLGPLIQMLISSGNTHTGTPRNVYVGSAWHTTVTHKIDHHNQIPPEKLAELRVEPKFSV